MNKILLTICLAAFCGMKLFAQDSVVKPPQNWSHFLHTEGGFLFPFTDMKKSISIRQNLSSYYVDQSSEGSINTFTMGFFASAKYEIFNTKIKTGFSTGIRFISYGSRISGYSSSNSDFFYVRYSMLSSDTKFARIHSIEQIKQIITIPLEIRYVLYHLQSLNLGVSVKLGTEFSALIPTNETTISFQEPNMNVYEDVVLSSIQAKSGNFYSTVYGSIGLHIGKLNSNSVLLELMLPAFYTSSDNFSLVTSKNYIGLKGSILFSLSKTK